MELLLASGSARRSELLKMMGFDFSVVVSNADEAVENMPYAEYVESLAYKKAQAVKHSRSNCCVIGSDTIVVLDNEILNKPADKFEAYKILKKLSGKTHIVYTGVAVLTDTLNIMFHDYASVSFAQMSDEEINAYIATGEPMDKAGGYGIQGPAGAFIDKIEGSYFTVVGLPLPKLYRTLKELGICPKWQQNPD